MELPDALSTLISLLVVYVAHFYYRYLTRPNPLPGPLPLPVLGNLHQIVRSDLERFVQRLHAQHGDIYEIYIGWRRNICVASSRLMDEFVSPSTNTPFFVRSYSDHLSELNVVDKAMFFNNNVQSWRFNRKILTLTITSTEFLADFASRTSELFDEMIGFWVTLDGEVDIAPWMPRFTSDMIISSFTGRRSYAVTGYYNSLVPSATSFDVDRSCIEESERVVQFLRDWLKGVTFFMIVPPLLRNYFPPARWYRNRYLKWINDLNEELLSIIRARKQEIDATPKSAPLNKDLLTFLILTNTDRDPNHDPGDEEARPLTETELLMLMREVFTAGSDTTAHTFSFVVYHVCKHRRVLEHLRKELDEVLGKGNKRRSVTYDDLKRLPYCEAVISETHRVMPVVSILFKQLSKDTEIGGYAWKSGLDFMTNLPALHKDPANWHEPERFNPDRWLCESVKKNSYLPFGAGIRVCPGKQLTYVELKILVAELFGRYDVELVDESAPLNYAYRLVNECVSLPIRIKERSG